MNDNKEYRNWLNTTIKEILKNDKERGIYSMDAFVGAIFRLANFNEEEFIEITNDWLKQQYSDSPEMTEIIKSVTEYTKMILLDKRGPIDVTDKE